MSSENTNWGQSVAGVVIEEYHGNAKHAPILYMRHQIRICWATGGFKVHNCQYGFG